MADAPRRRIVMRLEIGADSWEELEIALANAATSVAMGQMRSTGASGGVASGSSWEADEDETITHESYFAAIDEWRKRRREEQDR